MSLIQSEDKIDCENKRDNNDLNKIRESLYRETGKELPPGFIAGKPGEFWIDITRGISFNGIFFSEDERKLLEKYLPSTDEKNRAGLLFQVLQKNYQDQEKILPADITVELLEKINQAYSQSFIAWFGEFLHVITRNFSETLALSPCKLGTNMPNIITRNGEVFIEYLHGYNLHIHTADSQPEEIFQPLNNKVEIEFKMTDNPNGESGFHFSYVNTKCTLILELMVGLESAKEFLKRVTEEIMTQDDYLRTCIIIKKKIAERSQINNPAESLCGCVEKRLYPEQYRNRLKYFQKVKNQRTCLKALLEMYQKFWEKEDVIKKWIEKCHDVSNDILKLFHDPESSNYNIPLFQASTPRQDCTVNLREILGDDGIKMVKEYEKIKNQLNISFDMDDEKSEEEYQSGSCSPRSLP